MSDIEPRIPFTVLETTLAGWCNHYFVLKRATLLDYYLAACPAVALFCSLQSICTLCLLQSFSSSPPSTISVVDSLQWICRRFVQLPRRGNVGLFSAGTSHLPFPGLLLPAPCCLLTHRLPCPAIRGVSRWQAPPLLSNLPTFQTLMQGAALLAACAVSLPCCFPFLPSFYRMGCIGAIGKKNK